MAFFGGGGWGAEKLFVLVKITKTNKSLTAYISANEMTSYIHLRRIILVSNPIFFYFLRMVTEILRFFFIIINQRALQFQTDTTKNEPQTHWGIENREDKLDTIHNSMEFSS